jgi:mannose-6-phosphate isomerase-like protein (cupin superfamily)
VTEPYFDDSGPAAPGRPRFISPARDITPRLIYPGLRFRPMAARDVMASFVWFEPGAPAPQHRHPEPQITICISGELTFTISEETQTMGPGDCVVIPPYADHEALAGPGGCHAVDIFSPPRQAMLPFMTPELFIDLEQGDR